MKTFILVVVASFMFTGVSFAKTKYTKDTGMKCDACHDAGKPKNKPSDNEMYKKAADGHGEGKDCNSCHKGKQKPA